jgi:beta-1,4-mannosyl-glycoprotein beta-1,4-N-acetylglucosaminyltransferase
MIYDCFTFNDELDLLLLRLEILSPYIDKFVIVEGNMTFSNQPKKLFFQENIKKFSKYLPKIIHIVVNDFQNAPDLRKGKYLKLMPFILNNWKPWSNEVYQRDAILRGLKSAKKDDIILMGDVDEIPDPKKIKKIKLLSKPQVFEQKFFYYYLNCLSKEPWYGTKAIKFKYLSTPQELRLTKCKKIIISGGWHFSFLGGTSKIQNKIKSFSHQEYNSPDYINLQQLRFNIKYNLDIFNRPKYFEQLTDLKILPSQIINNKQKWNKYFKKILKPNSSELLQEIINERRMLENQSLIIEKIKQNYSSQINVLNNELLLIKNSKFWKIQVFLKKFIKYFNH